jgi:hypothetical protein
MKEKVALAIGAILILFGLFQPDLGSLIPNIVRPDIVVTVPTVDAPEDEVLLEKGTVIVDLLRESNASGKREDCLKLSSLYKDMGVLISLDGKEGVIKDTASIREANVLAGKMLKLDIDGKYDGLAEAAGDLVASSIGKDEVVLNDELRAKSVEAFNALSWAFYEGSK